MKKMRIESSMIQEIPCMLVVEEGAADLPAVIIAHGFTMDRYEGMYLAVRLAEKGFAAITFDLHRHGQRYDGFLERIGSDVDFGYAVFGIIKNSFHDLEKIIHHFRSDSRIDMERLGLTGISLGANLCYYSLANGPDIKVAVPILGSPQFTELLCYNMEKSEQDFIDDEKDLLNFVREMDPGRALLTAEPRALLMINASKDEEIPAEFAAAFYRSIERKYSGKDIPVEYFEADEFHYVSREMKSSAIEWFEKYL